MDVELDYHRDERPMPADTWKFPGDFRIAELKIANVTWYRHVIHRGRSERRGCTDHDTETDRSTTEDGFDDSDRSTDEDEDDDEDDDQDEDEDDDHDNDAMDEA
ncbi:hypothetical protein J4E85_007517 [Alternaria conjuncta]|uniref:uncharacterized protein n=1 Tax=Alternaria conjuncta TaxID=181017 RepID=UPI00221FE531|nr:uncharacterized protein J4E85_007517 [Alternaria conjuncta]KAI4925638.1 hypothetical protein J4E85_007517 [Alternaria conjuncta]